MWLKQIIETNLMKLTLLLKYAPNSDVLPMTTELWIDAFNRSIGRIDEGLDAKRINKAFERAQEKFIDWPSPKQVIELMPRRPEAERLTHNPVANDIGKRYLQICGQVIAGDITKSEANKLYAELDIDIDTGTDDEDQPF